MVKIDISKTFQTVRGFGVTLPATNVNSKVYTRPFLESLLKDLGCSIIRTMFPTQKDATPDPERLKVQSADLNFMRGGEFTVRVKVGTGIVRDAEGLSLTGLTSAFIEDHVVTSGDISSKSITLTHATTDTNKVVLTVYGGVPQNIGTDYTCTNSTTVSWNGKGLDGIIAEGEEVRLIYPA